MPNYYKINLKDKNGNIIYPNIHHSVNINKDGIISNVQGIKLKNTGGSWITSMTTNNLIQSTQHNSGSFWPVLRIKTYNNHYAVFGGITDTIGFYGFLNGRTENATDWQHRINVTNGGFYNSGEVSFGSTLTVAGATTLTGNVNFKGKAIFPVAESWFYSDGNYGINLNNNDIVNVNTIYYSNDVSESSREGIRWKRNNGNYDTFNIVDGEAYMFPNIALENTSTTSYKFLTTGNYTTYVVPKSGGTFTGNIRAPEILGMHRGINHEITVTGSSNTFYPVVITLHANKYVPTYISIWKNLGTTTPDVTGNHNNGTSSMWLIYEGRNTSWDGNGGFLKCWYYSMPFAQLCAHTERTTKAVGKLVVWLRGGTCSYNITTTEGSAPTIYYSAVNLGSEEYPINLAPRTTIGNEGKYSSTYLGYGNIVGNATTADTATTATSATTATTATSANSVLVNRALPTSGTSYPVCFLTGSTDETSYKVQANPRAYWNFLEGTASAAGYARIRLGNSIATGTAGNAYGALILYSKLAGYFVIQPQDKSSGGYTTYLPNHTTYLVGSSNNTVRQLLVMTKANWDSNYSGYITGTIGFCY